MEPSEIRADLGGVVAVTLTPFDADGAVDEAAYARVLRRMLDARVPAITVNGDTSEFSTLTPTEARRCVELAAEVVGSAATLVVGVGFDVLTAADAARHARRVGARAVMVHQNAHPYQSPDGWVEYHRRVARAVPDLAVIPYVRDAQLDGTVFAALGDACPNVVAVEYAVADPVRFAAVARDAGLDRFAWIAGLAELAAPAYTAVGARGFTSGLVNVAPELSVRMATALREQDFPAAMEVWERVRAFEEMRTADGSRDNVSVVKEAMHQLGLCRADVRPPGARLDRASRQRVAGCLASWGLSGFGPE